MTKRKVVLEKVGLWLSLLLLVTAIPLRTVSADTASSPDATTQKDIFMQGIDLYDINEPTCGSAGSAAGSAGAAGGDNTYYSTEPSGEDQESRIWNFFTSTVGLSPVATAGIMGNMQAESHFDPAIAQTANAWSDMSDVYFEGVGLVQWDGGRRPAYIKYANSHNADPKILVPQLNYVWHELNGAYKDALTGMEAQGDPGQAALIFHQKYEISADDASRIQGRMDNATAIFNKYSGTSSPGACGTNSGSLSPQCASAVGNARIICAAEQYDPVSYKADGGTDSGHGSGAEWHSKYCPVIGPSCYLDCSGLVDIAVYDVYGVSLEENTDIEREDSNMPSALVFGHYQPGNGKYWKVITFGELQPGDIVQPEPGHVEVVDHVQGQKIYTFAAHTSQRPQPEQVGPSIETNSSAKLYLRYVGPGAAPSA